LAEYPALLSWHGHDRDGNGGLLGIATDAYGDAGDPERERWFTRGGCAEVLIEAGAVVTPSVCEGILRSRSRVLLELCQRKGLLLRGCPLEAVAGASAHFSGEVSPAGVAVLTRDHELRIALRQGHVDIWHVHSCTGDGLGVTGSDVASEFLGLFPKGLERRTSRKRLRRGHGDLLSSIPDAHDHGLVLVRCYNFYWKNVHINVFPV
jgi:hypothetical protein